MSKQDRIIALGRQLVGSRKVAVSVLAAALGWAVPVLAQPVVDRPADLPEGRFLRGLNEYGMVELVQAYTRENPADTAKAASPDELDKQLKVREAAGDWDSVYDLLVKLTETWPNDPRINQWRQKRAALILDRRAESVSKRLVYEVATAEDLKKMTSLLAEADAMVSAAVPAVASQLAAEEEKTQFDPAAYQKLTDLKNLLSYHATMLAFYKAQLAWQQGARVGGAGDAATLANGLSKVKAFFERIASDQGRDPNVRALALSYMGWAYAFNSQDAFAVNQANDLINLDDSQVAEAGKKVPPSLRFEGYTLKARALRSQGQFGGSNLLTPGDIRDWPSFMSELAKQANRSNRSPQKRIWEMLSESERKEVRGATTKAPPPAVQATLIAALNRIIRSKDFYKADDFKGINLPGEAQKLQGRPLSGPVLERFNRLAMESMVGRPIAASQLGAMAVLNEQAALISDPASNLGDPMWRMFNILARANTMVAEAAATASAKSAQARDLEKQGSSTPAQIEQLRSEAQAVYDRARNDATDMMLKAGEGDEKALPLFEAGVELMWTDPQFEKASRIALKPGEVPSEAQLAEMPLFKLKRLAGQTYQEENFEAAAACYQAIFNKGKDLPDKQMAADTQAQALFDLGRTYYFHGQKEAAKQANVAAEDRTWPELYGKSAEYFRRQLTEFPNYGEKRDALKFIASGMLKQPDVYQSQAKRDQLIAALQDLLTVSQGEEIEEFRMFLAEAFYKSGRYREASTEYARVSPKSSSYDQAREGEGWAIINLYSRGDEDSATPNQLVVRDMQRLMDFVGWSGKRAAELRRQADALAAKTPPTATQPDAQVEALRKKAEHIYSLGADFHLEAGRFYFQLLDDAAKAVELLNSVPQAYKDLPEIGNRALSYKISILLSRKQFDDAIKATLDLVKRDPRQANRHVASILALVEKDFKQLRAQGKIDLARAKAEVAEQFGRTLVEQSRSDSSLDQSVRDDFVMRWARALNWLNRSGEALAMLEKIYVAPTVNADGQTVPGTGTSDPEIIIELGDAYRMQGRYQQAVPLYLRITGTPSETYTELWWRAYIGQCDCYLNLGESIQKTFDGMLSYRALAEQQVAAAPAGDQSKGKMKLPDWLVPYFTEVQSGLRRAGAAPVGVTRVAPEVVVAAPAESHKGSYALWLMIGGAGGIVAIGVVYVSQVQRQRRNKRRAAEAHARQLELAKEQRRQKRLARAKAEQAKGQGGRE